MTAYVFALPLLLAADVAPPAVLDDRLQIQLVAAEPDVRTPTGIAVDSRGRVLVIESHTHFRPANYQGPEHDRILLLDDFDPETGKARKISVFFEGTTHTMNLAVYHDGSIYVATRREIFRLRDTDGDGQADERTPICRLETPGNYPHNGLSGFAFDFAGNVYFGFGENLGAEYKLIGSDGVTLTGGGEGGNIYCCDPEGKSLRRVATGFWNPFHLCFDAFGRLFAVDNDPDSRPPCRLLHIVEGGDYGFRFRNGRKGVHPFTAWNGELPGTLPMVAGTGEAPSGILAYESDNLPDEYRGDLLVTSWGDHRIERYTLRPRGASFSAEMTPVVRGDENFRPVGIALAPDGSLFISDWVDKSYPIHGKGRVWRLSAKNPPKPNRPEDPIAALSSPHGPWREAAAKKLSADLAIDVVANDGSPRARSLAARRFITSDKPLAIAWREMLFAPQEEWVSLLAAADPARWTSTFSSRQLPTELFKTLDHDKPSPELKAAMLRAHIGLPSTDEEMRSADPFLLQSAAAVWMHLTGIDPNSRAHFERSIVTSENGLASVSPRWEPDHPVGGLGWAFVVKGFGSNKFNRIVPEAMLASDDPRVLSFGLQWIAELRDQRQRKNVEWVVSHAKTRHVFEAALATLDILDHGYGRNPSVESSANAYIAKVLNDRDAEPSVRSFALRSLAPNDAALTRELLDQLLRHESAVIRLEAIRTIRLRPDATEWPQLRQIAAGDNAAVTERCEAIMGLSPQREEDRRLLVELTGSDDAKVANEAVRMLRGAELSDDERRQIRDLVASLDGPRKELAERSLQKDPPSSLPQPQDHAAWLARAEGEGDPAVGERIFFHPRVGGCYRCHEFEGRGNQVGPDLTTIGRSMTRERLIQSIVDPSREIAPQFTSWQIRTVDGQVKTGLHVGDEIDGRIRFADAEGRTFHIHPDQIDERKPSQQSLMPERLADNLTPQELRDLVAFLLHVEEAAP